MHKPWTTHIARALAAASAIFVVSGAVDAQPVPQACGSLTSSFGPYDYRTADAPTRHVVESNHFNSGVEALRAGMNGTVGGDIGYTLAVFPNHHRALISMMNLGLKLKVPTAPGARHSVECYFDRAMRFKPDDAIVRMIYAKYLASTARRTEAIKQLEVTSGLESANAFTQYNIGLLYLEMNEFDRALAQAHTAQSLGFDRPALKERLIAAKRWREPPAASVAPGAAAASGSDQTAAPDSAASAAK